MRGVTALLTIAVSVGLVASGKDVNDDADLRAPVRLVVDGDVIAWRQMSVFALPGEAVDIRIDEQRPVHEYVLRSEHGVARHLRAGARRGRDGNERGGRSGQWPRATDDFQIIEDIAVVGHQRGDGFAGIDGAAAAKANDQSASLSLGQLGAANDGGDGRFAGHGKGDGRNAL